MIIIQIVVVVQLLVSLYLTNKVWGLQEDIEDAQMMIGYLLMENANKEEGGDVTLNDL
jgi:hypothetical protein